MKTIKNLFFSMATMVALSVSFTSCDAITDALSKEVEVEAPAIEFNIGGATAAPMQKVKLANGETKLEYVWLDRTVNIKSELETELAKNNLTIDKVKTLIATKSKLDFVNEITSELQLGTVHLYIDDDLVAYTDPIILKAFNSSAQLYQSFGMTYDIPFDIFGTIAKGSMKVKITSDKPAPSKLLQVKLLNTYKSKISLL
jgi:hypothetical protein